MMRAFIGGEGEGYDVLSEFQKNIYVFQSTYVYNEDVIERKCKKAKQQLKVYREKKTHFGFSGCLQKN